MKWKKSDDKNLKTCEINKALVVLICIEHYDGYTHHKNEAKNLKSTQIDKKHIFDVLGTKYNYDIICNNNKCTMQDLKLILNTAQNESRCNYQYSFVIYSGHVIKIQYIVLT